MTITEYQPKYADDVFAVCVNTGPRAARKNRKLREYILKLYCEPYIDTQTAFVLVDEAGRAQGYILCAPDYDSYCVSMQKYLEDIKKISLFYYLVAKSETAHYSKYAAAYPAHLHIDINEEYTHGGNGTRLMNTLLDSLAHSGVPGVMLCCSASNSRAIAFYQKCGFEILESGKASVTFAKKLALNK